MRPRHAKQHSRRGREGGREWDGAQIGPMCVRCPSITVAESCHPINPSTGQPQLVPGRTVRRLPRHAAQRRGEAAALQRDDLCPAHRRPGHGKEARCTAAASTGCTMCCGGKGGLATRSPKHRCLRSMPPSHPLPRPPPTFLPCLQTWFGYGNASIEDTNYQVRCTCVPPFLPSTCATYQLSQGRLAATARGPQKGPTVSLDPRPPSWRACTLMPTPPLQTPSAGLQHLQPAPEPAL